jgi:hypothetical protein
VKDGQNRTLCAPARKAIETALMDAMPTEQRLLEPLANPKNVGVTVRELCRRAGVTRYRATKTNLRRQLERIVKRAGLEPWPKLWHNLRASRQTELAERYPIHVVCAWIGNSRAVAQEHYLQVTDTHFANAAQNQAQQSSADAFSVSSDEKLANANGPEIPMNSEPCGCLPDCQVTPTGIEPVLRP